MISLGAKRSKGVKKGDHPLTVAAFTCFFCVSKAVEIVKAHSCYLNIAENGTKTNFFPWAPIYLFIETASTPHHYLD